MSSHKEAISGGGFGLCVLLVALPVQCGHCVNQDAGLDGQDVACYLIVLSDIVQSTFMS